MYGKNINVGLPLITNTEPRSLSYFKYAKNSMRVGDFNPNYSGVQMPYHPYHEPSQIDPLYKSQDVLLNNINLGKHPYLNSYPLPPIHKNKENPIKEIRSGELVDFPDETYIPLSKFVDYKNKKELEIKINKEKEKAKEEERRRIDLYGVNGDKKPSGASDLLKFHKKNLRHWKFLKNSTNIICGYLRMKKLAMGHKDLHAKRFVLIQSAKEGMVTIRDFLLPILSNIEDYCVEFFKSTIIFTTNNKEKLDKSIFVTKAFIHQLFSDLTAALTKKDDIPIEVKRVINSYITDGSLLPYGFLSTFEFNRLEFTTDGLLTNMNIDRQGLLVCFIVLYRILLADIFKRYLFYFKKIREIDLDEMTLLEIFEKKLEEYEFRLKEKNERNKRKIFKRGKIPGIIEEEDEEEKEKREKEEKEEENKLFEEDEKEENAQREKENKETMGLETHHACPPKKKKKAEPESEDSDNKEESSEEENNDDEDEENSKSKSRKSNKKSSKKSNSDISSKVSEIKIKKKKVAKKTSEKSSENKKSISSKNKSKKSEKSSKKEKDDDSEDNEDNDESEKKEEKKIKGKEYGYSGYLNKKKGKYYHEKGIYFNDEREKGVNKELLKEEERVKEEKLREKLENSNSSKSSVEESEEEEEEDSEKKEKDKKSSSNSNTKKSSSMNTDKKSSSISESEKSSSYKPKNINEAFWGLDLDKKEEDERKKREQDENEKANEIDPIQERKNRIKKLPKELRIKILEEEREKLKLKVKHNFHVITNILHSILRDSMTENVPFYNEYYKEKFLYKALVFQKTHKQYSNGSDEIELSKGIIIDEESTEIFINKNQRWAQMYKLLTFQFCRDFAIKCREGK